MSDDLESPDDIESARWEKRKQEIGKQILRSIAESPRDIIIQGKRYRVTMKSYERGPREECEGVIGIITASSDDEHFDYDISMAGWGSLRSFSSLRHDEEEGD